MFNFARSTSQYKWVWQNPQWQFGFRPLIQEFWNERPPDVPFTWTHLDIDTDIGSFSEDTFPPGLVKKENSHSHLIFPHMSFISPKFFHIFFAGVKNERKIFVKNNFHRKIYFCSFEPGETLEEYCRRVP